jgi:hypothetical protein
MIEIDDNPNTKAKRYCYWDDDIDFKIEGECIEFVDYRSILKDENKNKS